MESESLANSQQYLELAYCEMAMDKNRELEATAWAEGTVDDICSS